MPARRKGKHQSRHRTHTVKPASLARDWKLEPLPKEEAATKTEKSK